MILLLLDYSCMVKNIVFIKYYNKKIYIKNWKDHSIWNNLFCKWISYYKIEGMYLAFQPSTSVCVKNYIIETYVLSVET